MKRFIGVQVLIAILFGAVVFAVPIQTLQPMTPWTYDQGGNRVFRVDTNGNSNIAIQDQFTEIVDLYLSQFLSDLVFTVDPVLGERTVTGNVTPLFVPVAGQLVCLKEGRSFYQGIIISVVSNGSDNYTITMDSPLDTDYSLAGGCSIRNKNLAVNGAVTPVNFDLSPDGLDVDWDVTRFTVTMISAGAPDGSKFADIVGGVTYGLLFRYVNGKTKNIFSAKRNADFSARCFDVRYDDRAGGVGFYTTTIRRSFNGQDKNGVVLRLIAATGDTYRAMVQDDLSTITSIEVVVQGHVIQD